MKRYLKAGSGPSQRFSFGNESGFETKGNDGTSNAQTIANVPCEKVGNGPRDFNGKGELVR